MASTSSSTCSVRGRLRDRALTSVAVLDISRCRLGKLPKGLKKLTRLTALIAKSCELSSLKHLPASLPLTSLIGPSLPLSCAQLIIAVSENPLTRLPDSVASLSQLEKLSAAKCGLTAAGLPDLSACTALREVRLAHNPLGGLPDHIGGWANGRLEILALGHCELPAILALDPLRRQSALSSLDVVGNAAFVVPATDPQHERYKSQVRHVHCHGLTRLKMVALLHSLRILDGQRFDPAFIARKAKRAARPAPLDPAKPTTSANAEPVAERPAKKRRTADVEVEPVVEPERKKKSKKRDRQDAPLLALPKPPPEPEATEPPVPPDARDRTGAAPRERTSVVAVVDVARPAGSGKKSKRKADAGPVDDGAELAAFFGGGNAVAAADDEATGLSLGGW